MKDITHWKRIMSGSLIGGLLLTAGCKLPQSAQSSRIVTIPERFQDSVAQTGGKKPSEIFFSDPILRSLIDTALTHNQDLLASAYNIITARARLYMTSANVAPSVNLVATGAADKYGSYTMNGIGNFDTNLSPNVDEEHKIPVKPTTDIFLGLRSNWEIDLWGKLKDLRIASQKRFLATKMAQQWLRTQITAQVAMLYFELQELDAQKAALEQNRSLQVNAINIVSAQVEAGRSTALASHQFEARLKHTEADIYTTTQRLMATENELNFVLGRYPVPIQRSAFSNILLTAALDPGLPAEILLNRPDIREAELRLAAADADVSAARKAFFPSLRLSAYAGSNSFKTFQLFLPGSLVYGLMGGLTTPIFNQRALKGNKAISEAIKEQSLIHYQKKALAGYKEAYTALKSIASYRMAYRSKRSEAAMLDTAVSAANELYMNGYANYLEVIDAQRNVLNASLEAATIQKRIMFSIVDLYRFTGGG